MTLVNLLFSECLKLKRTKIVPLSILGSLGAPLLMILEALYTHFNEQETLFTLYDIYDSALVYMMLLANVMTYIIILSYVFSREYMENTLKLILPIPVSRTKFIFSKFILLFFWMLVLSFVTWFSILTLFYIYHFIFGIADFTFYSALAWLIKYLFAGMLIFFSITPFAYLAQKSKGFITPLIYGTLSTMVSVALLNRDLSTLYPFTISFEIIKGNLIGSNYPSLVSIFILSLSSTLGFIATLRYFYKEDIN
jgi:bacitracin transport system permease protein